MKTNFPLFIRSSPSGTSRVLIALLCLGLGGIFNQSAQSAPAETAQDGFRGPIQSALIPSSPQAEEMRTHVENYLAQQAGAPIVLDEKLKNDERAYQDFWWSAPRYT